MIVQGAITVSDRFPLEDFLFNSPLYRTVELPASCLVPIRHGGGFGGMGHTNATTTKPPDPIKYRFYCEECDATLDLLPWGPQVDLQKGATSFSTYIYTCPQDGSHRFIFILMCHEGKCTKVGQYPTVATLKSAEFKQFKKVLGPYGRELQMAIGLASHDSGIGAFAYLRRVFESVIWSVWDEHKAEMPPDLQQKETFFTLRMDEKIKALSAFLPEFVSKNSFLYAILSKGLHELTEKECLTHFESIYESILVILEEAEIEKQRRASRSRLEKSIQGIHSEISK